MMLFRHLYTSCCLNHHFYGRIFQVACLFELDLIIVLLFLVSCRPDGGGRLPESRSQRKRWQIESIINLAQMLLPHGGKSVSVGSEAKVVIPIVVDFCGGCGHVGLVLSELLPHCQVVICDLQSRSLAIAQERISTAGLKNCRLWQGDVKDFDQPFDVGLALHACGDATDIVLQKCISQQAAIVCAPCCVGKLRTTRTNNIERRLKYLAKLEEKSFCEEEFDSLALARKITYPRSDLFRNLLTISEYNSLATAGDIAEG
jgi:hypothetical protein